jgi:Concanavalin A-like lectin/glucanases superfamily
MSALRPKPIIHGRDHLAGGADPIPGLIPGSGDVIYADYVRSFSSLVGYWRLGETGTPWLDSSGYSNELLMNAHGVAMTPDVTGALPVGQDDGAVKFNYTGTSNNGGDWLSTTAVSPVGLYQLNPLTCAAFVKVHAYPSDQGMIAGSQGFPGGVYTGWAFRQVSDGKLLFSLGGSPEKYAISPGALVLDTWYHVAGTYDGTTIRLYLNGVEVATTAFSSGSFFGSSGMVVATEDLSSTHLYFTGSVDELAVWSEALSADEIALLASAVDGVSSGDGDQVLVSDGAGGSHWGQANGNAIADASIVNRHVATGADIDVLKLAHPGGTSTFLRADGTWAAPASGTTVATDTIWDTKGDMAAATGADAASKVAVGTNGQVLTADSTASTGVKWATPTASSPSADTQVWMPLTTTVGSDDVLVFDANHQLIPTLTAI